MKNKKFEKSLKYILVGSGAGIINGFFGAGAGLILVPLISCVGGLSTKKSHATTLVCVLLMCISGSFVYFCNDIINLKLCAICTIGSVIGAIIGSKLLKKLKNDAIDFIFSIILILAGISIIIF